MSMAAPNPTGFQRDARMREVFVHFAACFPPKWPNREGLVKAIVHALNTGDFCVNPPGRRVEFTEDSVNGVIDGTWSLRTRSDIHTIQDGLYCFREGDSEVRQQEALFLLICLRDKWLEGSTDWWTNGNRVLEIILKDKPMEAAAHLRGFFPGKEHGGDFPG